MVSRRRHSQMRFWTCATVEARWGADPTGRSARWAPRGIRTPTAIPVVLYCASPSVLVILGVSACPAQRPFPRSGSDIDSCPSRGAWSQRGRAFGPRWPDRASGDRCPAGGDLVPESTRFFVWCSAQQGQALLRGIATMWQRATSRRCATSTKRCRLARTLSLPPAGEYRLDVDNGRPVDSFEAPHEQPGSVDRGDGDPVSPIGFGRSWERVLNTPVSGFRGSSRGWTASTSGCA